MLFDRKGRRLWIWESLSSSALSDGFFGDCLLDAEVKLVGESHAGTVDLAQDVKVLFVLVPVQDEVSSPDKRYFLLVQSFLDEINLGKEEVDKVLPFFGFIVGVLGSREEGGGEGVCVLSGFLMHHENGLSPHHKDSDFSLLDSWQEFHINQHSLVSDDVLITEVHVVTQSSVLDVVVDSFSALDLGVKRESITSFVGSIIFNLNSPNTLTSRTAILLEHTLVERESSWEILFEVGNIVVDIGVFGDQGCLGELAEGVLGAEVDHGIRVGHANKTSCRKFPEGLEEDLFTIRERTRVNSSDIAAKSIDDVVIDGLGLVVFELNDLRVPALGLDGFNNGQSVLAVPIRSLIAPSDGLEDDDGTTLFDLLGCHARSHYQ